MDFATEEAQIRKIKSSIQAVGEVKPQPRSFAEIVSPVEGIISIAEAKQLVNPGQTVKKGQSLAILVPPLSTQNSWTEIYLQYEKTKTEFGMWVSYRENVRLFKRVLMRSIST